MWSSLGISMSDTNPGLPDFDAPALYGQLNALDGAQLDALDFGVIHFGPDGIVKRYNATESRATGVAPDRVVGQHVFTQVAQCMNNFMVAQRFEDAFANQGELDATLDYVLTWRMRPTPVKLRLLCGPGQAGGYVVVRRLD